MIEFLPKSAVFLEPIWLLVIIPILIAGHFQNAVLRFTESRHNYQESLVLLVMQLTIITVVFGMSLIIHGMFLITWIFLGYLYISNKSKTTFVKQSVRNTTNYSIYSIGLVVLLASLLTSTQIHYDYFHGTIPSIDLAIHAQSPSEWLSRFDPTYWPILTQTILPVLDATEIYYTRGGLTNILPFIFLALLVGTTLSYIDARPIPQMLITIICLIYLLDFAQTPRPHVLIGFSLSLLILSKKKFDITFITGIIALILSKRDSIPILSILSIIVLIFYLKNYFFNLIITSTKEKLVVIGSLIIGFIILLIISDRILINDLSLIDAAIKALGPSMLKILTKTEVLITLSISGAVILTLVFDKKLQKSLFPLLVILSICIYIVFSAFLLQGLNQYNEGTIIRKLTYMLLPPLAVFFVTRFEEYNRDIS
jgi:hypothetical protein